MTEVPRAFTEIASTWRPPDQVDEDVLGARPATEFAAMLDQPSPVRSEGDALPPLWHWFYFAPSHPQSTLGEDGHPGDEGFLPPLVSRRRMFGGGRVTIHEPLRCGDHVQRRSSVHDVRARLGSTGPLLLVSVEHHFSVAHELRVVEMQHIVYRRASDIAAPRRDPKAPVAAPRPADLDDRSLSLDVAPDPRLLFRFSALTANAHRIHYDQPYATQVEGYPGLVVQGPLLALLLLELPRRHDQRDVATFSWRVHHPVYVHEEVRATGTPFRNELSLQAEAAGPHPRATGVATMRG